MIHCSEEFLKVLKSPIKEFHLKFEFYDSQMNYIEEFTQNISSEDVGQVICDATRPIRRSFSFSLVNRNGKFTWGDNKLIWLDKRVKIYTGLKLHNGSIEYISQGVFILSQPQDEHTLDNGVLTTVCGFDKAYLMTDRRGKFVNQLIIPANTPINSAIKMIAQGVGETMFNFDPISDVTPYELAFEPQSNRWDAIKQLSLLAQCDVYFDTNGYLRLRKINLDEVDTMPVLWTYKNDSDRFYAGNIRSMAEGEFANAVRVVGGNSSSDAIVYDLVVDENINAAWTDSPYSINKIGEVWYFHNDGNPDPLLAGDLEKCKFRAKYELMNRLGYSEEVELHISPNYLHEPNDVIEIVDDKNNLSGKYLLQSFSMPLTPQLMTCKCVKYKKVIDNWDLI